MSSAASEAMYIAALLRAATEAGVGVLTLTEGLDEASLTRSRLTREIGRAHV